MSSVFFLPTMMNSCSLKWIAAMISFSQGWKNANLMLEKGTSIMSPLLLEYLNPLRWHYSVPFIFFWPTLGLANKSLRMGLLPLFKLIFSKSTISSFAFFSLISILTFFWRALTCFYSSNTLLLFSLRKYISLTNTVGSVYLGKFRVARVFGKWKLNLSEAYLPY